MPVIALAAWAKAAAKKLCAVSPALLLNSESLDASSAAAL